MAARNNPCMRNSQSLKSWGSICGNSESGRLASAAMGGPMQGLMCEHVSGQVDVGIYECLLVCVDVCECVCAETGWVE